MEISNYNKHISGVQLLAMSPHNTLKFIIAVIFLSPALDGIPLLLTPSQQAAARLSHPWALLVTRQPTQIAPVLAGIALDGVVI